MSKIYAGFLWVLVWGGMFTGHYNMHYPEIFAGWKAAFQGLRGYLPLLALYLCLLWLISRRLEFGMIKSGIGFLFLYCLTGLVSSLFLSVEKMTSLYYLGIYFAALTVVWYAFEREDALDHLKVLIYANYACFFVFTYSLMPEALRVGWGNLPPLQQYTLPAGLGLIRTNGAGRFALVVIIFGAIRFLTLGGKVRWAFLAIVPPALFLLTQTQSRTSLLGLAVVGMLYVFIRGLDWRYLFVGPVAAVAVFISGFQWRSHGDMDALLHLTGREYTWRRGWELITQSPFLGWGFFSDRIMLHSEHMHHSYLHAMIHSGFIGGAFFAAAFIAVWVFILRRRLLFKVKLLSGERQALLTESILIFGYLFSRSFFESTAAFYGVDLLLLVPAMAYIIVAANKESFDEPPATAGEPPA
jgi:O-antigen ligase